MMISDLDHIDTIAEETSLTGGRIDLSEFFQGVRGSIRQLLDETVSSLEGERISSRVSIYSSEDGNTLVAVAYASASTEE